MDAFSWEVVGSVAGVAAAVISLAMWLLPSPRHAKRSDGEVKESVPLRSQAQINQEFRAKQVIFGAVPRRPVNFIERSNIERRLMRVSEGEGSTFSLVGIPGSGKSQVAAALARKRILEGWRLVAWINSESYEGILEQLSKLAFEVGLKSESDAASKAHEMFRHWLEADGDRCLLVFDNVIDADAVQLILPSVTKAHVIFTSSRRPVANLGARISVGGFTPAEAAEFLHAKVGHVEEVDAKELAGDLDYLPLAISQAAAVLASQGWDYATYKRRLADSRISDYLNHVEGDPYPLGVAETIAFSVDTVGESHLGKECRLVLELLSVLSPSGVSRHLLYKTAKARSSFIPFVTDDDAPQAVMRLKPITTSDAMMDEALRALSDASLLSWTIDGSHVLVHRLVARVVREYAYYRNDLSATSVRAVGVLAHAMDHNLAEKTDGQPGMSTHEVAAHVVAVSKSIDPFEQLRKDSTLDLFLYLQYLAAVYFEGTVHGYRERLKGNPEEAIEGDAIAWLESLIQDVEALKNPVYSESADKFLAELKEYLLQLREL